jgi:hypothetical protein
MHFYFKIVKSLLLFTPLYMFRTLRAHHQEPFYSCTCSLWLPCDLYRLHSVSIIRSPSIPAPAASGCLVTCIGCVFQHCYVVTGGSACMCK